MRIQIQSKGNDWLVGFTGKPHEFHAALTAFKLIVSEDLRRWNRQSRAWLVNRSAPLEQWLDYVQSEFGAEVIEEIGGAGGQSEAANNLANNQGDAYTALHLLPSAPIEVIKAAYRALAILCHPDRGGDEEAMKRVNIAYESITRQLEARHGR